MENTPSTPFCLDSGYSNNWNAQAKPVAILNEASTVHERVAYCWGLASRIHELSMVLQAHSSPDVAQVSGMFYDKVTPLVAMLERLGLETNLAEKASKNGGAA